MSDPLVAALADAGVAQVRPGAPLHSLTTLRVGGPARALVVADHDHELGAVGAVTAALRVPWTVLGRGSNVLISDRGFPGVVVRLGRGYRGIAVDGTRLRAGAAEPLPTLAVRTAEVGLAGFAWACSVPGALGGAVRMNAGAHGADMAAALVEAELVRVASGTRETWPAAALELGYRRSVLPSDAVVVSATLALQPGDPDRIRAEIRDIRRWRRTHQPLNEPNCGSVFTNPPGDSAGRLIDACGGKAVAVGGARVSERHANFIVTAPGATAADVRAVIARVRALVRERAGVELTPEVRLLGDHEELP